MSAARDLSSEAKPEELATATVELKPEATKPETSKPEVAKAEEAINPEDLELAAHCLNPPEITISLHEDNVVTIKTQEHHLFDGAKDKSGFLSLELQSTLPANIQLASLLAITATLIAEVRKQYADQHTHAKFTFFTKVDEETAKSIKEKNEEKRAAKAEVTAEPTSPTAKRP